MTLLVNQVPQAQAMLGGSDVTYENMEVTHASVTAHTLLLAVLPAAGCWLETNSMRGAQPGTEQQLCIVHSRLTALQQNQSGYPRPFSAPFDCGTHCLSQIRPSHIHRHTTERADCHSSSAQAVGAADLAARNKEVLGKRQSHMPHVSSLLSVFQPSQHFVSR